MEANYLTVCDRQLGNVPSISAGATVPGHWLGDQTQGNWPGDQAQENWLGDQSTESCQGEAQAALFRVKTQLYTVRLRHKRNPPSEAKAGLFCVETQLYTHAPGVAYTPSCEF